ncbi:hypothetical protein BJX61DRAFT_518755 [Aspergillus egyptiacus]|nr:hypothetical protein BJX61DRAFT_518755 [Aspergillus egyptiacus]
MKRLPYICYKMRHFAPFLLSLFVGHLCSAESEDVFLGNSAFQSPDNYIFSPGEESDLFAGISLSSLEGFAERDILPRQGRCPYPVMCSARSCCPAGTQCCTSGIPPLCCPTDSNCRAATAQCCPKIAVTCGGKFCAQPGSICCGSRICPGGTQCNTNGGASCCRPNELKCPGTCCPPGSECGPQPGYCRRTITTTTTTTAATTTTTSTRTTTQTQTETTTTSVLSTGRCGTSSPRGLNDVDMEASLDFEERDLEPRQRYPFDKTCIRACYLPTRQEVMVLNLKRIVGQTDQLVDSTCRGMRARRQAGQIPAGLKDGEDILTYNGGGQENRYSSVKCDGFCGEANAHFAPNTYQCDEYPPAQYNQEGNAQTALCIERYQNSGTQGPILRAITRVCKPSKGDKLLIRVEGGCPDYFIKRDDEVAELPPVLMPRQEETNTLTISSANATLRDPLGDGSLTYVAVDLGELPDGHYDLDVALDGPVTNVTVLEADGDTYARVDSPPEGQVHLSWDVATNGAYLTFAVIAYTEKAVNVSYTGNFTPVPNTADAAISTHAWSPAAMLISLLTVWLAGSEFI